MSAVWQLAYLNTTLPTDAIIAAVAEAARAELEGRIDISDSYRAGRGFVSYICRNLQIERWETPPDKDSLRTGDLGFVIYPAYEELTAIYLTGSISGDLIYQSDPDTLAEAELNFADPQGRTHELVAFPRIFARLSALLGVDAALLMNDNLTSTQTTAALFFAGGRRVASYYTHGPYDLYEGHVLSDETDALLTMFDGRFAFLRRLPIALATPYHDGDPEPWIQRFHFDGADINRIDPDRTVYRAEESRLYIPFWGDGLKPAARVFYSLELLRAGYEAHLEPFIADGPAIVSPAPGAALSLSEEIVIRLEAPLMPDGYYWHIHQNGDVIQVPAPGSGEWPSPFPELRIAPGGERHAKLTAGPVRFRVRGWIDKRWTAIAELDALLTD